MKTQAEAFLIIIIVIVIIIIDDDNNNNVNAWANRSLPSSR
jgi:hypothetical protein